MYIAKTSSGELIIPTKEEKGFCVGCGSELVSKMGDINRHHWAHKNLDCDSWSEGETEWHLEWKTNFDITDCEVKMDNHRADIFCNGTIVEVQHSPISVYDVQERELFYKARGEFVWVFDVRHAASRINIVYPSKYRSYARDADGQYIEFYWKQMKKVIEFVSVPFFLDTGKGELIEVRKKQTRENNGCGWLITKEDFINRVKSGEIKNKDNLIYHTLKDQILAKMYDNNGTRPMRRSAIIYKK